MLMPENVYNDVSKDNVTGRCTRPQNNLESRVFDNLVPRVRFSFGQHQEHGLWLRLWPLPFYAQS